MNHRTIVNEYDEEAISTFFPPSAVTPERPLKHNARHHHTNEALPPAPPQESPYSLLNAFRQSIVKTRPGVGCVGAKHKSAAAARAETCGMTSALVFNVSDAETPLGSEKEHAEYLDLCLDDLDSSMALPSRAATELYVP